MKHYHIILLGLFTCVFNHVRAQEHRLLRDPYAYETAAEMYAGADTLPFDDTAARLVADISRQLERGFTLEDEIIWDTLQKLEPYRKSGQVQKALKTWVEHIKKPERSNSSSRHTDLSLVIQAYRQGEFDRVIAMSRELLRYQIPMDIEQVVRNNLALALMHENRDLCAQIELELLNTVVLPDAILAPDAFKRTEPPVEAPEKIEILYFPALINLTVVYERLGKREKAELLANRLTEYMKKEELEMPLVDFNAAWFLGEKGDYHSVDKALTRVGSILKEAPKYADYRKQLAAKYKSFSILKIGFMGKGFAGSGGWWLVGILLFILYWILTALGAGTSLFKYFMEESDLFFLTLLIPLYFAVLFILAWGIPSSVGGWIGLVVLAVGSFIFVLAKAAK